MSTDCLSLLLIQNGTTSTRQTITTNDSSTVAPLVTENPIVHPTNTSTIPKENKRQPTPTPFSRIPDASPGPTNRSTTSGLNPPIDITQFNYDDHWQEYDVELERVDSLFFCSNVKKNHYFFLFH